MRRTIIAASFAAMAACNSETETVPEANAARETTFEQLGQDEPGSEGQLGWLEADAPGETTAAYRGGPNAVEFSLTCAQTERTLTIKAEQPIMDLPADAPAILFLGAAAFAGQADPIKDSLQAQMTLPVSPILLKALTEAKSARLTIGDAFTETGQDDKQALAHLAQSCAIITGMKSN